MLRSTLFTLASLSLVAQTAKPETKPEPKAQQDSAVVAGVATASPNFPAPGSKAPEDKILAKVGDEVIRESDIEQGLQGISAQQRQQMESSAQARQQYIKSYLEFRLLVAQGKKLGLHHTDPFKKKLAFAADQIVATELMAKDSETLKKKIEQADVDPKAYYEAHKDKFQTTTDTYSARHILVKVKANEQDKDGISDADAKVKLAKIQAEVKAGKKLADLAKEYSDDPGSKDTGGLYENFDPGQMVPEFGNAVRTQAIGVVGEPVKTQFGYHIVEVTAKAPKGAQKPFESVSKDIPQMAQAERQEKVWNEYLDSIKKVIPFEVYGEPKTSAVKAEAPAKATPTPAATPKKTTAPAKKVDAAAAPKKNA
jgi:peptidyl-prolyl cis-trans isomerase C